MLNNVGDKIMPSLLACRGHLRRRRSQLRQEVTNVDQVVVENLLCILKQAENRRIADRIEDVLSFFTALNDVALPQDGKLLRQLTLFNFEPSAQVVYSDLPVAQGTQDLDSQGMSERFKEFRRKRGKLWHMNICIFAY